MTQHPTAAQLEAYHAQGTGPTELIEHLENCLECQNYLKLLEAERLSFLEKEGPEAFLARSPIAEAMRTSAPTKSISRRWVLAVPTLALTAAAAGYLFNVGPSPQIGFKGTPQLKVLRLRDGKQSIFSQKVSIKAQDKLRFEVTISTAGNYSLGIQEQGESWQPIFEQHYFEPGNYFVPDDALEVLAPVKETEVLFGPAEDYPNYLPSSKAARCQLLPE